MTMTPAYDRLTALDNSFLMLESPHAPLHVASTLTFEAAPLRKPDGGIDADAIRGRLASELHRIPRYRQKLAWIPLTQRPVWIDDDRFNIDYHVRHTSLPRPGSVEQLKRLSSRIMEQALDQSRPLWEMWVVEGLEGGDRFALISKVHHCMIDGMSGVDLLNTMLSPTADVEPEPEAPRYIPRRVPTPFELWRDEMLRRLRLPFDALGDVRQFVTEAADVRRELTSRFRALAAALGTSFRVVPTTPFNHKIGPHRRFDWLEMNLDDIKAIRRSLGGSINDVVLTVVTGAVQRFLERRNLNPGQIDFRVMTPVSVRSADQRGKLGNRVSAWFLDLPIGEPDPREQLRQIRAISLELKESKQAVAASMLTDMAEWGSSTLLALGARNVTRMLPFNLVVTNVPGPQHPIFMVGSRMLEMFPLVPLVDNLGLGIALMSYSGKLFWGFNADYDLLPDLGAFVRATRESFEELVKLAGAPPSLSKDGPALGGEAGGIRPPAGMEPQLQLVKQS
jgi:diacylglycerol O-acyltransferase / wax synthase